MTKKGEIELVKKINRTLILNTIRETGSISRARIADITKLSRSTVSKIVDTLVKEGLITECGFANSAKLGGRKAREIKFNPNAQYGVGVDIGGTKILMIMSNLNGEIIHKKKINTNKNLKIIVENIRDFINECPVEISKILGMGIGIPGILDSKRGYVIESPQLGWQNYDIYSEMKDEFPFPIYMNNDVNCGLLGEHWLGSAKKTENVFFVAIGTGVGSAMLLNGYLIEGERYSAGEIGYFVERADVKPGFKQKFGSFGSLESKTSGTYFSSHGMTGEELFRQYDKNDEQARKIIDEAICHLSVSLSNIVSLLNPKVIVIGGGVSNSFSNFIDEIKQKVSELTPITVDIKLAQLKDDAGALGAISYAFDKANQTISRRNKT